MGGKKELPLVGLSAFSVASFVTVMTENLPAGLLPSIGRDLEVSQSLAGQLLTAYAIGSVAAAVPVVAATRSFSRRPLLLTAVGLMGAANALVGLTTSFNLQLVARSIAGMAAGVVWSLLPGYARSITSHARQGRALAIVGVGQPLALSFGVPLGAWIGLLVQWRGVFWCMSILALVLIVWIRISVPNVPGLSTDERKSLSDVAKTPGLGSVLFVLLLWLLSHSLAYTYIAPLALQSGIGVERVGLLLALFGIASVLGIWLVGIKIDDRLGTLTILSLGTFVIAAIILALGMFVSSAVYVGVVLWGVSFGGAPVLLQAAVVAVSGRETNVAISMFVTVFNIAVAGGGMLGGVLLTMLGAVSVPPFMCFLGFCALIVAHRSTTALLDSQWT